MNPNPTANLTAERQKEISDFMTAHLWVAMYNDEAGTWTMSKEQHPYSFGPFEVMAVGTTLEDAFEKAKAQQGLK